MALKSFTVWIELVPQWGRDGYLQDIKLGDCWTIFPSRNEIEPGARVVAVNITIDEAEVMPLQMSAVFTREMVMKAYQEAKNAIDG